MSERDVKKKNFVFFGGSQGMGRATALELAKRGASILIVGRNRSAGDAVVAQARSLGASSADFLSADLSGVAGVQAAADGVLAWKDTLHGVMHTAMSAFSKKQITNDGFEFAFALQYFARAALNRLLMDSLAAGGDGRIVHLAGNISPGMAKVDLNDLQFEHRKWSFVKAIFSTHHLGFLHLQEAARRASDLPICFTASCVESVKTNVMLDPKMPLFMRLMGRFGTTPELASRNAVTLLTTDDTTNLKAAIVPKSKSFNPEPINRDAGEAAKLWGITTDLAQSHGLNLPWA
jgi:NAD(P)-dependent dehydrogenase (short-subunit alcohol dehydrogenase family)